MRAWEGDSISQVMEVGSPVKVLFFVSQPKTTNSNPTQNQSSGRLPVPVPVPDWAGLLPGVYG